MRQMPSAARGPSNSPVLRFTGLRNATSPSACEIVSRGNHSWVVTFASSQTTANAIRPITTAAPSSTRVRRPPATASRHALQSR